MHKLIYYVHMYNDKFEGSSSHLNGRKKKIK